MKWWREWREFRIRREACRLAAATIILDQEKPVMPMLWCTVVFYEQYLSTGAEGTKEDFGPKTPVELKAVVKEANE